MSDTSDEVLKRVDAAGQWVSTTLEHLAAKLGTTLDYLWPTYVRAVVARGAQLVGSGVLLMLFGVLSFMVLRRAAKKSKSNDGSAEVASTFSWILLMTFIFIGVWVASSGAVDMIAPEPEALTNIVRSVQSLNR